MHEAFICKGLAFQVDILLQFRNFSLYFDFFEKGGHF